jgi:hypothetical protein
LYHFYVIFYIKKMISEVVVAAVAAVVAAVVVVVEAVVEVVVIMVEEAVIMVEEAVTMEAIAQLDREELTEGEVGDGGGGPITIQPMKTVSVGIMVAIVVTAT